LYSLVGSLMKHKNKGITGCKLNVNLHWLLLKVRTELSRLLNLMIKHFAEEPLGAFL
jgi:hypothetical protein